MAIWGLMLEDLLLRQERRQIVCARRLRTQQAMAISAALTVQGEVQKREGEGMLGPTGLPCPFATSLKKGIGRSVALLAGELVGW